MKLAQPIDDFLNGITMYRLMVYVLALLLIVAGIFAGSGILAVSALGIVATTATLLAVSCGLNYACERLFKTTANAESWLITALILACILPPSTDPKRLAFEALAAVVAIVGKFLGRRYSDISLNPAAAGALTVGLLGLVPVTWWIGAPPMFIITLLLGLMVLRKTRRFEVFAAFALAAGLMMLLVTGLQGQPLGPAISTLLLSYPLLFLGTIMLTEPSTMPAGRLNMALYGLVVGALFSSQLRLGILAATPHMALILGNVFSYFATAKPSYRLRLRSRTELAPNQYDLAFEIMEGKQIKHLPGQYMEWTLGRVGNGKMDLRGNRRTFSMASSPTEPLVHLGIKTYEPSSTFKQNLLALKPGQDIQAGHVGGNFVLPEDPKRKLLCIAGGIGVTPFRSMMQYLADSKQSRDVVVLYSARSAEEFVFKDILESSGATVHYITERLTPDSLAELVPDYRQRLSYISGPNAMVEGLKSQLRAAGVKASAIRSDHFSGY